MANTTNMFDEALEKAFSQLSSRSKDIIKQRFGIGYNSPKTLDAIGKECDITRERVRQIVSAGIQQINETSHDAYRIAQEVLAEHVRLQGGIVHVNRLLQHFKETHNVEAPTLHFFIAASEDLTLMKKHRLYPLSSAVHVNDFDFETWHEIHNDVEKFLKDRNYVCTHDDLYAIIAQKDKHVDSAHAMEQLHVSHTIKRNPFGKWGLTQWNDVTPKNIRDKVHLILEHSDRPMHFRDIAKAIDKYDLGKGLRSTHPQTVHNELIKDKRFVLVGRGTYKLAAQGDVEGSVRDIIVHLLTYSEKPMTAADIIDGVLKHRVVQVSTIKINLHAVAKKQGDTYTLK